MGDTTPVGAIIITGNLDLDANIIQSDNTAGATSLAVSGTSNLGADVTTSGTQTYTGATTLSADNTLTTTSNGNVSLLTNMAKNAGLPWDAVLSAELSKHYKPDPEAYLAAAELLSLPPEQVMMVAAHPGDLRAASRVGLRTAYVIRPLERGPGRPVDRNEDGEFDYTADNFVDLARKLGA